MISIRFFFFLKGAFFLFQGALLARPILCTHPEVCKLAKQVAPTKEFKLAIKMKGDLHHFDPSPKQIKTLYDAPFLLTPSLELQPWLRKVKRKKETYTLTLYRPSKTLISKVSWAHFWLNPYLYCKSFDELKIKFEQIFKKSELNTTCPLDKEGLLKKLKKKNFSKNLFAVTHDSLGPLFKYLGYSSLFLKSSGHRKEIRPQDIKRYYQESKKFKKVIWIKESHIKLPPYFKKEEDKTKFITVKTVSHTIDQKFLMLDILKKLEAL